MSNGAASAPIVASHNASNSDAKLSLLSLPLVPPPTRLTNNLLPDIYTPRPDSLLATPSSLPTQTRRARPVGSGAHFSYVSPLVLAFPYDFPETNSDDEASTEEGERADASAEEKQKRKARRAAEKRMEVIESYMRRYEVDFSTYEDRIQAKGDSLHGYLSPARAEHGFPSARLLGLSRTAIEECLPQLDVGDAFEAIAAGHGKDYDGDTYTSGPEALHTESSARAELSGVVSGWLIPARFPAKRDVADDAGTAVEVHRREMAREKARDAGDASAPATPSEEEKLRARLDALQKRLSDQGTHAGYAPWANCYAGHQFGSWAGQLGDGRAITLMEVATPAASTSNVTTGYGGGVLAMPPRTEIQLKGAGRTPYSRFADGLAVLASSVREYLCSEAMAGLRIPTSRALALTAVKDVTVLRERASVAAVVARLAPSWLRIGSFQIHASRGEWESVRLLGEYVARDLLGFDGVGRAEDGGVQMDEKTERKPWALKLAEDVARRNAETIARWQVYGFMHGGECHRAGLHS